MRAILVYNPTAGQMWAPFRPDEVVDYLGERGWEVDCAPTQAAGDAARIARDAVAGGYDLVIGAGGDGTLNELTQGLAGTKVPLAILPAGTTNVLARELGFPLSVSKALEIIPTGVPKAIDLGIANGRYFLFVVGAGFDALVNETTPREFKRVAGFLAFFTNVFKTVVTHKPFPLRIQLRDVNGRERRLRRIAHQVVVTNTELYGTGFRIAPGARFDDGQLELMVIRGARKREFFWRTSRLMLWPFYDKKSDVDYVPVTNVTIRSRKPMPVQIDGEHYGTTPVEIGIRPLALNLWLPPNWRHPNDGKAAERPED